MYCICIAKPKKELFKDNKRSRMENNNMCSFKVKNSSYVAYDQQTSSYATDKNWGSDSSIYSIIRLQNGFIFKQNASVTKKRSFLFLNTEQMTVQQLAGKRIVI